MSQNKSNILIGAALVVLAAVLKITTFPHSVNPIIAISLFSGAIISNKKMAFVLPLFAMLISDVLLEVLNIAPGFYGMGQIGNYASLLFVTLLGFQMKKINTVSVVGFSIASSLIFFFLSNTNSYFFENYNTYGTGFQGWANCMIAGIPFVKNSLVTDLCFSAVLFGTYQLSGKLSGKSATI
jgi:hypothetical protein